MRGAWFNFQPVFQLRRGRGRKKNRDFYPVGVKVKKRAGVEVNTGYTLRPRFYPEFPKNRGQNRGKIEKPVFNLGSVSKRNTSGFT